MGPYLRHEKVPSMAPAAIPTANPIMKPILTRSKQLGWVCPYGPTATGIWESKHRKDVRELIQYQVAMTILSL